MNYYKMPVYILVVAVIVFIIAAISYLYYSLFRYKLQAVNAGLEDEKIKKEYDRSTGKISKAADILSAVFTVLLLGFFAVSLYAGKQGNYFPVKGLGTFQVVASGSMSFPHQQNTYLAENSLTNQFDTYDIIGIAPVKEKLKLYDVAVYEKNGQLIAHRVIDITEKDGTAYYIFRGDANTANDGLPVAHSDIMGIYTGVKIPAFGIFVIFLQSALGYTAMGIVLIMEIIFPVFEKRINTAIRERLKIIGYIK